MAHTVSLRPPTAAVRILTRNGPFDISCRQVALVQVFIQALPLCTVSTLPPTLRINALLCILFGVKSRRFTSYCKETILCVAVKNNRDGLGREWGGVLLLRECGFVTAYNIIKWVTVQVE